jgi:hypothetical protein
VGQPSGSTPVSAPNLGYAYQDNQPVSVLMRVLQPRVLQQLNSHELLQDPHFENLVAESISGDSLMAASSSPVIPAPDPNIDGATSIPNSSAQIDSYLAHYTRLVSDVGQAKNHLDTMKIAARQAATDLARFTPTAVEFVNHFSSMLSGLDPIFPGIMDLLKLPLKYRIALTQNLHELIQEISLPETLVMLVSQMYQTIDQIQEVVGGFQTQKNEVEQQAGNIMTSYRSFSDHLASIASLQRLGINSEDSSASLFSVLEMLQA